MTQSRVEPNYDINMSGKKVSYLGAAQRLASQVERLVLCFLDHDGCVKN